MKTNDLNHALGSLGEREFTGWTYELNYHNARVLANDAWLATNPLPRNGLLLALPQDRVRAILLRVVGPVPLPLSDEVTMARLHHLQQRTSPEGGAPVMDPITASQLQYSGLECRVLGTFYQHQGDWEFGADLDRYRACEHLKVYRPTGQTLSLLVNFIAPLRRGILDNLLGEIGAQRPVRQVSLGYVRCSATRNGEPDPAQVYLHPADLIGQKIAVFGQTRSGKSNLVKSLVSGVHTSLKEAGVPFGVLIADINAEYCGDNVQDNGSLASLHSEDVLRYSMRPRTGFLPLMNNFYIQPTEGLAILRGVLHAQKTDAQPDVATLLNAEFLPPDTQDHSARHRYALKLAAWQTLLYKAGFTPPLDLAVRFEINKEARLAVESAADATLTDPAKGMTLEEAEVWFSAARAAQRITPLKSASGKPLLDHDVLAILNLLAQQNGNRSYITGWKLLASCGAKKFHSARRQREVSAEIYDALAEGKIVILDLALGDPLVRQRFLEQIASEIFHRSLATFSHGERPPLVMLVIEEAHNLMGRDMKPSDPWPRLAKESAKLGLTVALCTQEPSSLHPDILSNTSTMAAFYLNNDRETNVINHYSDFGDFSNVPEVGWCRLKLSSHIYVVPTQIHKFVARRQSATP